MNQTLVLLATIVPGIFFLGLGLFLVIRGLMARAELTAALVEEGGTARLDESKPGVPVRDAASARMGVEQIKSHTLGTYGPFQSLPRDDPARVSFLNGLTLRNALNLAILAYGVANLSIATGAAMAVLGGVFLLFGVSYALDLD